MVLGSLKETLTGTLTDDEDEEEERQPFVSATERLVSDKVRRGGRQPFVSATERLASQKIDMDTAEGLMKVAMASGDPEVIEKAKDITNANDSLLKQIGDTFKVSLTGFLDVIQRPNYAIASAVKNIIDKKPETTVLAGFKSGITGETKHTFADVFEEAGWNPETRAEKITRSVAGFTADVLLDPTTYVTFGVGSGIKVVTMTGKKVMTKEGAEFFGKAMARRKSAAVSAKAFTKAERKEVKNLIAQAVPRNIANETISSQKALQLTAEELGDKFVKESMVKMAETSPELSNKFFQQGGLKFFGKTLISGGRINTVIKTVPGISKFDDLTKPTRDSLGALFDRNVSAKFGRLPEEFADLYQKFIDISRTKSEDAVNHVIDIARSNNLTYQEAEIIANAIENGTHLADARLENASKLFQRVLGRDLKKELKAGIKKAELPNFVPHMLVDAEVSKRAFKAPPASKLPTGKTPGSAKERKIIRFVSEAGDEAPIGKAESLGLRKVNSKKMIQAVEKRTKETTVKLQKTQRKLAKPEIDLKTSDLRSLI